MAKSNKVDLDNIDAESIIHSFRTANHLQMGKDAKEEKERPPEQDTDAGEKQELETPVWEIHDPSNKENRRKRGKTQDYESLFIREVGGITAREGKTVYIRKQYHDRVMKIVRVIGANELSLFSYLDNVLEHHFSMFQEDITMLYNKKNEGIF